MTFPREWSWWPLPCYCLLAGQRCWTRQEPCSHGLHFRWITTISNPGVSWRMEHGKPRRNCSVRYCRVRLHVTRLIFVIKALNFYCQILLSFCVECSSLRDVARIKMWIVSLNKYASIVFSVSWRLGLGVKLWLDQHDWSTTSCLVVQFCLKIVTFYIKILRLSWDHNLRFVTLCKIAPYRNSLTYLLTYLSSIRRYIGFCVQPRYWIYKIFYGNLTTILGFLYKMTILRQTYGSVNFPKMLWTVLTL